MAGLVKLFSRAVCLSFGGATCAGQRRCRDRIFPPPMKSTTKENFTAVVQVIQLSFTQSTSNILLPYWMKALQALIPLELVGLVKYNEA